MFEFDLLKQAMSREKRETGRRRRVMTKKRKLNNMERGGVKISGFDVRRLIGFDVDGLYKTLRKKVGKLKWKRQLRKETFKETL